MSETEAPSSTIERPPLPLSEIDSVLTVQLAVAWAGELGESKRLGWWRSDLVSEFGGHDLFRRLLPNTWEWAVMEAAREAACRKDAELRRLDPEPDRIISLYCLGFAQDERINERLMAFKRQALEPRKALPGLAEVVEQTWNRERFLKWVNSHGAVETTPTSIGRRLKGSLPANLEHQLCRLVGALAPLTDSYPLPHFRRPA